MISKLYDKCQVAAHVSCRQRVELSWHSASPPLALATIRKVEENLAEENTKVLMISHKQMGEGQVKGALGTGEGGGALACLDEEGKEG
ncbi:hypothetical protein E2C01_034234 [Portunus trituberculatus]|uniref:Uncharacterized protein n=1 Tax=Portunus trituberculatus TaxID=210409 RepID=A0A5B7F625_PORTR|nr:hypothetical protein [Portunus trituberculatus]